MDIKIKRRFVTPFVQSEANLNSAGENGASQSTKQHDSAGENVTSQLSTSQNSGGENACYPLVLYGSNSGQSRINGNTNRKHFRDTPNHDAIRTFQGPKFFDPRGSNFEPIINNRWIPQETQDESNKKYFAKIQEDAENAHDAWKMFEVDEVVELSAEDKTEVKLMENEFKRNAQQNFAPFLVEFFKSANIVLKKGKKYDLCQTLLREELRKVSDLVPHFPSTIILTTDGKETQEAVDAVKNFTEQGVTYRALSGNSSIEELEDAAVKLVSGDLKILIVNGLCLGGKYYIYCDKLVNYSVPVDLENYVLRLQNIKKYSECYNFISDEHEMDFVRQLSEVMKTTDVNVPEQVHSILYGESQDRLSKAENRPLVNDMMVKVFTTSVQEYKILRFQQKHEECANYLLALVNCIDDLKNLPRVIILTHDLQETTDVRNLFKSQNVNHVTISSDTREKDMKQILGDFSDRKFSFLIGKDVDISERKISCDTIIYLTPPNIVERYALRLESIQHDKCITYVDGYNTRFLLRNLSNILKASGSEPSEGLKGIVSWSNCGKVKLDQYHDISVDCKQETEDDALFIAGICKKFIVLPDYDKLKTARSIIASESKKAQGSTVFPRILIIMNTEENAKSLEETFSWVAQECVYLPFAANDEQIRASRDNMIVIVDDKICPGVEAYCYTCVIHYELPDTVERFLHRIKIVPHSYSVVFASKGKDMNFMNEIAEILQSSSSIQQYVRTLELHTNMDSQIGVGENDQNKDFEIVQAKAAETKAITHSKAKIQENGENKDIKLNQAQSAPENTNEEKYKHCDDADW